MLNFLSTFIVSKNFQKPSHNSKESHNSNADIYDSVTKRDLIFRGTILGILTVINIAIAIAMVIIAMVIGIVFMTILFSY